MAKTTWPPACDICSRFISYADLRLAVSWQPYGSYEDDTPPPEEFAHRGCWDKASDSLKLTIEAIAYGGVYTPKD